MEDTEFTEKNLNCIILGDKGVGKDTLFKKILGENAGEAVSAKYSTTIEGYTINFTVSSTHGIYIIIKFIGEEETKHIRTMKYSTTDVFIICFSVMSSVSLNHVVNTVLYIYIYIVAS